MKRYNPKDIEPRWQRIWEESGTYTADLNSSKPKYIAMSMFNYPSGAGIHIGHAMNYTISDVKARFKRQQGYESYHPVGWDSFGLPAENYAIKAGVSPQESMAKIIPGYHKQYKAMGWSNDWEKEIAAHLPEYYKWTQWIFVQMHKHNLAYQDARQQWWCEKCQTVLANEQVIDGKCWRHDGPDDAQVQKREVKQWFFKITDYADELLEATDGLDWTESVKQAQKNWIGKSIGAEIEFQVESSDSRIKVFTTRADTIFGATFLVLAPEHELVKQVTTAEQKTAVEDYVTKSQKKTEVERQTADEKTGVFTGAYAVNPANNEQIPIWIADFVLGGYGTGAVFGDAHDSRDTAFARKFNIPLRMTVNPVAIRSDTPHDADFIKKRSVVVVVENDKQELLTINWGDGLGGRLFVGGTIEGNESPEITALREVEEETGYSDLEISEVGEETFFYKYFAFSKGEAHDIETTFVRVRLKGNTMTRQKLDDSEMGRFKVEWVNKIHAEKEITEPLHRYAFEKFILGYPYTGDGILFNSGAYDGLETGKARKKIVVDLSAKGLAHEKVNYKMRDWSVSRQRYWGAPIPVINCSNCGPLLVPEEDLPVVLPELDDFKPSGDGRSALARAADWLKVNCYQCGGPAERETDTLDTYIDSSWYMYRYFDPRNQQAIFDSNLVKKWEPIDFYNGADHATAHLLYARFIGHFFKKIGLVNEPEPFKQFLFNGKVTAADGQMFSKSKGNGVDPLEIIEQGYGADALRIYLMFAAPLDLWIRWDPQGVPGAYRFLSRVWALIDEYTDAQTSDVNKDEKPKLLGAVHRMIKKVTHDIEANHYNTAIAAMMGYTNELYKLKTNHLGKNDAWQQALEGIVVCVAPFAPHIADELWHQLGHSTSVHHDTWPKYDEIYTVSDTVTIVVQINGKVRAQLDIPAESSEADVVSAATAHPKITGYLEQKEVLKTIYVPQKLINFVV